MKKKVYLICYAIFQFILGTCYFIFSKALATNYVEMFDELLKSVPEELKTMFTEILNVETLSSSYRLIGVIGAVVALVLLYFVLRYKISQKKGVMLGLTIALLLLFTDVIFALAFSIIALIMIAKTPKEEVVSEIKDDKEDKEKKEIQKLRPLKVTSKDLLLTIIFTGLYFTQFFLPSLSNDIIVSLIMEVVYYLGVFGFGLYVYGKRIKRDGEAFKKNIGTYLKYALKMWGIMFALSYVAVILRLVLGGDAVTANQAGLNEMPIWYVGPLAVIWAPFVEELLFRIGLRRFVKNDVVYIALSAIIFGLLHTFSSETGLYNIIVQSLQYMVMGGVMAYAYSKTNNMFVNISIHAFQNTLGVLLMLFM